MKQIGLGFAQYIQDFDETFPGIWNGSATDMDRQRNYPAALMPYLKSNQIFVCPSESRDTAVAYPANNWLHNRALADIQQSARVVVAMDGYLGAGGNRSKNSTASLNGLNDDYTIWNATRRITSKSNRLPRHLGTNNVLYADGHVKAMPMPEYDGTNGAGVVADLEQSFPTKSQCIRVALLLVMSGPINRFLKIKSPCTLRCMDFLFSDVPFSHAKRLAVAQCRFVH